MAPWIHEGRYESRTPAGRPGSLTAQRSIVSSRAQSKHGTGIASGTRTEHWHSQWHTHCAACGSVPFGSGQRQHCVCGLRTANVEFLVRASEFYSAAGLSCVSTWFGCRNFDTRRSLRRQLDCVPLALPVQLRDCSRASRTSCTGALAVCRYWASDFRCTPSAWS